MDHSRAKLLNIGALIVALIGVGLLFVPGILVDPTPMLAKPDPDLDIPLGLLGFSVGLWAAYRITTMPTSKSHRVDGGVGRCGLCYRYGCALVLPDWAIK